MDVVRRSSFLVLFFLVGCAAQQQPIALTNSFYEEGGKNIGILRTGVPIATTMYTGQIGLLDYAIISVANSGLDEHLATLTFPEYDSFIGELGLSIEQSGFNVSVIDEPLTKEETKNLSKPKEGISTNDFSRYKSKYNLDYLMIINFRSIGTTRSYYSIVPTSEPSATSWINGQIINLDTNELYWYADTISQKNIQSPWDEGEASYPNLTNAVYQSLNDTLRGVTQGLKTPQIEPEKLEAAAK